MSAGYKIYETGRFIKKIHKDKLDIDNFKKVIQELASASIVYKDHNLLIDIRDITPPNCFGDILAIIIEAVKYYHVFCTKIAVIVTDEPARIRRVKFFKAGLPKGKYQFDYFTDYEDAIDWLSDVKEFEGTD